MRLTVECRAKALEAGVWQRADGRLIRLTAMNPAHLVNAYLGALQLGEPASIVEPLAQAVMDRGLVDDAVAEVQRRSQMQNA